MKTAVLLSVIVLLASCQNSPASSTAPKNLVDRRTYDDLPKNVSLKSVVERIGHEPTRQSSIQGMPADGGPCQHIVTATWANPDGSSCTLVFADGSLHSKSQTGLKE